MRSADSHLAAYEVVAEVEVRQRLVAFHVFDEVGRLGERGKGNGQN